MNKTTSPTQIFIGSVSPTPLSVVWAAVSRKGLWALDYRVSRQEFIKLVRRRGPVEILEEKSQVIHVLNEILEFLEGDRNQFATPIDWTGMTEFQKKVRQAVMGIPYGQTATYAAIAARIGRPGAARAVGRANATNPIPFVIPCHRVVGADGNLRGYGGAGGIETKKWLLKLERASFSHQSD
jgi:methylated-DNA-[protein]-cysteine S-methyltransferase